MNEGHSKGKLEDWGYQSVYKVLATYPFPSLLSVVVIDTTSESNLV